MRDPLKSDVTLARVTSVAFADQLPITLVIRDEAARFHVYSHVSSPSTPSAEWTSRIPAGICTMRARALRVTHP